MIANIFDVGTHNLSGEWGCMDNVEQTPVIKTQDEDWYKGALEDARVRAERTMERMASLHDVRMRLPHVNAASDLSKIVEDMAIDWRQLIVIGNGFDLQCGLKSQYWDCFKRRFDIMPTFPTTVVRLGKSWWIKPISLSGTS